jgi:hypothetical protein
MRIARLWRSTLFCSLIVLVIGCTATLECGTWVFSGTPTGNSFPLQSAFTFNPAGCGQTCTGSEDVMVQMTWVYDISTHTNLYASDQPQGARSTADGWAIDQLNGWAYGYYGVYNNGVLTGPGLYTYNSPGGPGTANTLYDEPGGWPANVYFYAVDVAVTYDSRTCNNEILGYYFWSYYLDSTDTGQKFVTAPAWKDLDTEFADAVTAWNKWAPTTGPQYDGSTTTLPHALPFPALTQI